MAEKKSILLRIDPALWVALQQWADDELRSLNGQMEWILREAVQRRKKGSKGAMNSVSSAIEEQPERNKSGHVEKD